MRSKTILQILFPIIDIILIIIISLFYYLATPLKVANILYIPQGSIRSIITQLQKEGIQLNPKIDTYILKFIGVPKNGWMSLDGLTSRGDLLYLIVNPKVAQQKITLIPGETTYMFLQNLSKDKNLSFHKLKDYFEKKSPLPEGWIIPETYNISIDAKEENIVDSLIGLSSSYHEKLSIKLLGEFNQTKWNQYLVIASIVQKEAANKKEMPMISSVIYNRLKKNMKLQMDGTLNYGEFSHEKISPERIKTDKSSYNTYLNYGLPPYPVSSVSKEAIEAAIFPDKSEYLYFVKKDSTSHKFSRTYNEHLNAIEELKKR